MMPFSNSVSGLGYEWVGKSGFPMPALSINFYIQSTLFSKQVYVCVTGSAIKLPMLILQYKIDALVTIKKKLKFCKFLNILLLVKKGYNNINLDNILFAQFQSHVSITFEVTTLKCSNNRKIDMYWKYRENKLQVLTKQL